MRDLWGCKIVRERYNWRFEISISAAHRARRGMRPCATLWAPYESALECRGGSTTAHAGRKSAKNRSPSADLKEKSLAKGGERRACDHCDANAISENDSPNVEVMKS
jgi:hypothetical protein